MFNLGWLPSGDRRITTRAGSTVAALEAARLCLAPGGRMSILAYRGHPGGAHEAAAVARWVDTLPPQYGGAVTVAGGSDRDTPLLYRLRLVERVTEPS
jgi:hypothetical protein